MPLLVSVRCVNCSLSGWHILVFKPFWAALIRSQRSKQDCLQIEFISLHFRLILRKLFCYVEHSLIWKRPSYFCCLLDLIPLCIMHCSLFWVWALWYSEIICATTCQCECVNCSLSGWHIPVFKPLWAALMRPQRSKQDCLQIEYIYIHTYIYIYIYMYIWLDFPKGARWNCAKRPHFVTKSPNFKPP